MYPNYIDNPNEVNMPADIDMRAHLLSVLYGSETERPRGRWIVIQKLIKDADGRPVQSPYSFKTTGEGKHAERGPSTTRTGYLCNEVLVRGLYKPASKMIMDEMTGEAAGQVPTRDVIYFAYEENTKDLLEKDTALFITLDDRGEIVNPVSVARECNITKIYPKHLDSGRIEYYACIVEDQK